MQYILSVLCISWKKFVIRDGAMLKSQETHEEIRLSRSTKEDHPVKILLAAMCIFSKEGRDEVSLSEFQECIAEFQQKYPSLGYSFSERFLLSADLLSDLRDLDYRGFIRDYHYRLDSLLPKRFLALTALGRGLGNKVLHTLTAEVVRDLTNAAKVAMNNYHNRWRLWGRKTA